AISVSRVDGPALNEVEHAGLAIALEGERPGAARRREEPQEIRDADLFDFTAERRPFADAAEDARDQDAHLFRAKRLRHKIFDAALEGGGLLAGIAVRRQAHERYRLGGWVRLEAFEELASVHLRHHEI